MCIAITIKEKEGKKEKEAMDLRREEQSREEKRGEEKKEEMGV